MILCMSNNTGCDKQILAELVRGSVLSMQEQKVRRTPLMITGLFGLMKSLMNCRGEGGDSNT